MPFVKRFEEIVKKAPVIPTERKLLIDSHKLAFIVFVVITAVLALERGGTSLRLINSGVAWTSVVFIGLSFALSGICYFWDFADTKIIYRKPIGVAGYHYGLIHLGLTIYLYAQRVNILAFFASEENFWMFMFGISALMYFTFMTFISTRYMVHELGGHRWRVLLRTGYAAFFFVIIHYVWQDSPYWKIWWESGKLIPPTSLVIFSFSILVFVLRAALEIHVRTKKKVTSPVSTQTPTSSTSVRSTPVN